RHRQQLPVVAPTQGAGGANGPRRPKGPLDRPDLPPRCGATGHRHARHGRLGGGPPAPGDMYRPAALPDCHYRLRPAGGPAEVRGGRDRRAPAQASRPPDVGRVAGAVSTGGPVTAALTGIGPALARRTGGLPCLTLTGSDDPCPSPISP